MLIARVLGVEIAEGVLEPEGREDGGSAVARAYDVEGVDVGLADETVDVSVYERETWTGSPVTEKSGLDVVGGDVTLNKGVVLEEDHR